MEPELPEKEEAIAAPILKPFTRNISPQIQGYYHGIPSVYNNSTDSYPLLIFIHGSGQFGNGKNDLPLLLMEGVTQLLDEQRIPPTFSLNNSEHSFVFLSPQFKEKFTTQDLHSFISFAKSEYRIDSSRIYLSGLSIGGILCTDYAAAYKNQVAAIVPMAGINSNDPSMKEKATAIAAYKTAVWAFHNDKDLAIKTSTTIDFINLLKKGSNPDLIRLTILSPEGNANHDAWTRATDPLFKVEGQNIYEWMLKYSLQ
ncbi:MAG: carboxylesterase family protein [Flavitalea sp.]